jgi:hypothetical protein
MKTNIYCHRQLSHPHPAEGYSKIFVTRAAIRDRIRPLHRSRRTGVDSPPAITVDGARAGLIVANVAGARSWPQRHEPRSADLGPTGNHDLEFFRRSWRSITKHTHHSEYRSPISFGQVSRWRMAGVMDVPGCACFARDDGKVSTSQMNPSGGQRLDRGHPEQASDRPGSPCPNRPGNVVPAPRGPCGAVEANRGATSPREAWTKRRSSRARTRSRGGDTSRQPGVRGTKPSLDSLDSPGAMHRRSTARPTGQPMEADQRTSVVRCRPRRAVTVAFRFNAERETCINVSYARLRLAPARSPREHLTRDRDRAGETRQPGCRERGRARTRRTRRARVATLVMKSSGSP